MSLEALREAADAVEERIGEVEDWDREVGVGADGKPTLLVDREAEDAALDALGGLDARVVSEEAGVVGDGEDLLLLDPLDGTGNAVSGVPFYCFSAALVGSGVALVRDLVHGDVFTYSDGVSSLNGSELEVSGASELGDASISLYTYGTSRGDEVSLRARRTRTMGSAALELCYVAAGFLDGMASLRGGLSPTDYGAGRLLVEGAGGVVEVHGEEELERVDRTVDLLAGPAPLVSDMGRWTG